jgi:tRNA-Thr(GGU) m(6)t(6)A37 methyltransferase TsaA
LTICLEPIGYVENAVNSAVDHDWATVESKIVLKEDLAPTLSGLTDFSHVLVVFWMHEAGSVKALQRRPQNRQDMPEVGLFSQRAKHRPNPIGITTVPIVSVDRNILVVRGLDAINGTPVLDIKPYFPVFDNPDGVKVPEWVDRLMADYF